MLNVSQCVLALLFLDMREKCSESIWTIWFEGTSLTSEAQVRKEKPMNTLFKWAVGGSPWAAAGLVILLLLIGGVATAQGQGGPDQLAPGASGACIP